MLGADGVGHQVLRVGQVLVAREPVVEPTGRQHVRPIGVTEYIQGTGVGAAALAMPRWAESVAVLPPVVRERVEQRRPPLILPISAHVAPGTHRRRVRFVATGYPSAMELIAILILIGVVVFVIAKRSGPRQQG